MEKWIKVPGYEPYEASSFGRIRRGNRVLGLYKNKKGYLVIHSSIKGKTSLRMAHVFVALAFIGDSPFKGATINHKNGIKHDNSPRNLEWISLRDNIRHSYKVLGRRSSQLGQTGSLSPLSKPIVGTHLITGEVITFSGAREAERKGFRSSGISECISGRYAHHKGYRWEFIP